MTPPPREMTLDLRPASRFQLIDVAAEVRERDPDFFEAYPRTAFCSLHTTAGYLEQPLCARLDHSGSRLRGFVDLFRRLFPPGAGYLHDRMELREELSEAEKETEPVNADSHLTFISAGLRNLVVYKPDAGQPVYLIDLDGVNGELRRTRRTAVLGFTEEEEVYRGRYPLPVGRDHALDSFDLKHPRLGLASHLRELLETHGVSRGRVDLRLAPTERNVGLTVNEFETLLMRNDLPAAMRSPLRYLLQRGRSLLRDPRAIPRKTRDYAVYDLVHLYNEVMDTLGVGRSVADALLSRLSGPAFRVFRLKRRVSFLVSGASGSGAGRLVSGRYQSPILIQHRPPEGDVRELEVTVSRFR
ncbi:MAG: hypothetical protein ACOC83_06155 [Gemmatimonadota bacterium]